MSKISELKDNTSNQINLVKVLEKIFPDRKTKYIELFSRLIREHYASLSDEGDFKDHIAQYDTEGLNPLEQLFLIELIQNILEEDEINRWKYFCNKFESNAINNVDLQTIDYSDLADVINEQYKIDEQKELEKQVHKLLDDDEWLVLVPLTYESSKKYGANTKWCTTAETIDAYNTYVKDGMLIYIINKKVNVKHAIYYEIKERESGRSNLVVYDAEDECVELIFVDIPHTVLSIVRKFLMDYNITTHELSKKKELNFKPYTVDVERNGFYSPLRPEILSKLLDDKKAETEHYFTYTRDD